jgi:predicted O-methyltransferase YrrM
VTARGGDRLDCGGEAGSGVRSLMRRVKAGAGGMLPISVYERLFRLAAESGGTIVEIGTAEGAATIALALGGRSSGKPFHVHTADRFDRGSRLARGSVAENAARVRRNLQAYGVESDVTLICGGSEDLARSLGDAGIDLLLIDADGCIDREMALFHGRLAPSANIVVDDVDGRVYAHKQGGWWSIDLKHRLSALLARRFCEMDMLVPIETIGQTGFYRKGPAAEAARRIETAALSAYREIVFSRVEAGQIGAGAALRRLVDRYMPAARRMGRAMRRRES